MLALTIACGGRQTKKRQPVERAPALSATAYQHYIRGRVAVFDGDYARAVLELRAATIEAPNEAPIRVALIDALYRAGHREDARKSAEAAQKKWPRSAEVWQISGKVYRGINKPKRAVLAYEKSLALDADVEATYLGLAAVWMRLKRADKAEAVYRRLIAQNPDSLKGTYRLAARLLARKAYSGAEPLLRRALQIDPNHIKAQVALAQSLRARGKLEESTEVLREAFDRSGGNSRVGEALFRQLLESGEHQEAVQMLSLLDRDDLDVRTRVTFGYLYLQVGEKAKALALAESLLDRHNASGEVRLLSARALDEAGRRDDAIAVLLDVAPERLSYPICWSYAAELAARAGRGKRAIAIVDEALGHHPRDTDLIIGQAFVYELLGNLERSRKILRAALGANEGNHAFLYAWASLEDRSGDRKRAIELMEQVLEDAPDDPGALNFIGFSLADQNVDLARAERLISRASDLDPDSGYILDSRGWLLYRLNRLDQAEQVLTRALRLNPTEPEILWHLGEVVLAKKDPMRALKLFQRAQSGGAEGRILVHVKARIDALSERK